jgi:ABC-type Fe3+ transport system permease subunit
MKIFILSIVFGISALLAPLLVQPVYVSAAGSSQSQVLQGVNDSGDCNNKNCAEKAVNNLFATIVKILSFLIGVIAIIMIIVAGFKYMTSNGDANGISNAKNTLIYALIGLVVAVLAQFLVQFVLTNVKT